MLSEREKLIPKFGKLIEQSKMRKQRNNISFLVCT